MCPAPPALQAGALEGQAQKCPPHLRRFFPASHLPFGESKACVLALSWGGPVFSPSLLVVPGKSSGDGGISLSSPQAKKVYRKHLSLAAPPPPPSKEQAETGWFGPQFKMGLRGRSHGCALSTDAATGPKLPFKKDQPFRSPHGAPGLEAARRKSQRPASAPFKCWVLVVSLPPPPRPSVTLGPARFPHSVIARMKKEAGGIVCSSLSGGGAIKIYQIKKSKQRRS